ncbi:MAG: SLC13/DASS family transporter [Oscillospiraceae bacterium]|nr:SLC13/DASS family transporter [Oscillospiraceae bacterium]
MTQSTIAIGIIICLFILYLVDVFPVAVTTMLGMVAMVFAGVLSFSEAFNSFANSSVMLVIGMIIIVDALLESGIGGKFGRVLSRMVGSHERTFVIVMFLSAAVISGFMTNAPLVAMYMSFIAAIADASDGQLTKKNSYMPVAMGALIGGTGTLIGSTAPLLANNVLQQYGVKTMNFFTPMPIALSIIVVVAICYRLFLYKKQAKWFDFEEVKDEDEKAINDVPLDKRRAVISGAVFVICVLLFIIDPFGWDVGLVAVSGALVLIMTKCIDGKKALKNMQWSAVVTLGAALAIATGFVKSGAGEVIINWLINVLGTWVTNPVVLVTVFLLAGYILSLFMANGSLVSMLAAIAVPLAMESGCDPMPVALSCVFGASLAMATPVASTSITMVEVAGYRFKDYFRVGGLVGVIGLITTWVALVLIYGLI